MAETFNINDIVRVKLTAEGWKLLARKGYPTTVTEDADGWSEWQLWDLMSVFGPDLCNGCPVPFETTIEIPGN